MEASLRKEVEVLNFVGSFAGKSDGIVPSLVPKQQNLFFEKQAYTEVNLKDARLIIQLTH